MLPELDMKIGNIKDCALGIPKYRICQSSHGRKIVFFCDWDYIHLPNTSFIGKPMYFQEVSFPNLPFRLKEIYGEKYLDLLKLWPHSLYICDLGLKMICQTLASDLIKETNSNILQTLCLVPMNSVIREVSSMVASKYLAYYNKNYQKIIQILQEILGENYEFGIAGYHALDPLWDENEFDIVIIAETIEGGV